MITTIGIYLVLGAFAGTIAGLLGVGGGLVIVPALVYLFGRQHFSPELTVHLAVGTSLATIVFTAISSVRAHHKRGAVHWDVFRRLTPGIVVGALLGALLAKWIPGIGLKRFFAIFEWLVAAQMLIGYFPSGGEGEDSGLPRLPGLLAAGGLIGSISSLVGIGGGTLTVPFLAWCRMRIQEAVATSSACALPLAMAGSLGFIFTGWSVAGRPDWSLGFIYLPALIGIILASVVLAPLGASLAHRLPAPALRKFFAIFLVLFGFYMFLPRQVTY